MSQVDPSGSARPSPAGENAAGGPPGPAGPSLDAPEPTEEATTNSTTSARRRHRSWLYVAAWVLVLVGIMILTPRFVAQVAVVDSYSMIPTLETGDRVMIEKLSPRFGSVSRGSVVVVANPDTPGLPRETDGAVAAPLNRVSAAEEAVRDDLVLKRVLAVGGDTIEMRDNQLLVNGQAVDEPYLAPDVVTRDFGPVSVPNDHIFIVGDNRNASRDSRAYGPVVAGDVVGRVMFRLWPPSRWGTL